MTAVCGDLAALHLREMGLGNVRELPLALLQAGAQQPDRRVWLVEVRGSVFPAICSLLKTPFWGIIRLMSMAVWRYSRSPVAASRSLLQPVCRATLGRGQRSMASQSVLPARVWIIFLETCGWLGLEPLNLHPAGPCELFRRQEAREAAAPERSRPPRGGCEAGAG